MEPMTVMLKGIEAREVRWLWAGRVPQGKVTLLAGDPGLGKSFITLDMAARLSQGLAMPGVVDDKGGRGLLGGTLILSAEDDPRDTIVPRLLALGAEMSMIAAMVGVRTRKGADEVSLDEHIDQLEASIRSLTLPRLVIIDPISAYMGGVDSHSNAQVRGLLRRLSVVAERTGAAVVCVTHLNKSGEPKRAVYRAMGSLAFTAAARTVHLVAKDPDRPERRLMIPVKNNVGPELGAMAYRLVSSAEHPAGTDATVIRWEDAPVRLSADDLEGEDRQSVSALEEAGAWLTAQLASGPKAASELLEACEKDGIRTTTLKRAKCALGVRSWRDRQAWSWELPARR